MAGSRIVSITVDVEQDCPPYLQSLRGITEGMGPLLALLDELQLKCTFFVTGKIAELFPGLMARIAEEGHELGCHGWSHDDFSRMDASRAEYEIKSSAELLRKFAAVFSFRAPYLRFPAAFLPLLAQAGILIDSSSARYQIARLFEKQHRVWRIPVSTTSSALRLPAFLRRAILMSCSNPVVLFVHPWEFVDFRRADIRLDCRFRTGPEALECLRSAVGEFRDSGAVFKRIFEIPERT